MGVLSSESYKIVPQYNEALSEKIEEKWFLMIRRPQLGWESLADPQCTISHIVCVTHTPLCTAYSLQTQTAYYERIWSNLKLYFQPLNTQLRTDYYSLWYVFLALTHARLFSVRLSLFESETVHPQLPLCQCVLSVASCWHEGLIWLTVCVWDAQP